MHYGVLRTSEKGVNKKMVVSTPRSDLEPSKMRDAQCRVHGVMGRRTASCVWHMACMQQLPDFGGGVEKDGAYFIFVPHSYAPWLPLQCQ